MAAMALLKPTVSWSQIRADRDRALQYQAAITQDAEAKKAEAQHAEAATQDAVAALYDVPFLEQDTERWKGVVDEMLGENQKKIDKDYGGDYERYARERFSQDTMNLKTKAMKHPLLKSSLQRRSDYVKLTADQSLGKIDRPVTYTMLDGKTKTAPATQNYLDFVAGKTEEFKYQGGYQAPTKYNDFFGKNYHPAAASDPSGKFKAYQATPQEIAGAMVSEDGLKPEDVVDYLGRFGNRLAPVFYKFDPRDPYKEIAAKQRDKQLAQGDNRLRVSWYQAQSGRMNARTAQKNAITAENKLALDKKVVGMGNNLYTETFDNENIVTLDKNNVPVSVPSTVWNEGKAEQKPWSMVGYDGRKLIGHIYEQLGIKEVKTKGGGTALTGGSLGEVYVQVPNAHGGMDLRKTDLSGLHYSVVGGNTVFRRNMGKDEQTVNQKYGGQEMIYPELRIRITAEEALKANNGKLFNNKWFGKESQTGAGAYRTVEGTDGKTYYEFPIIKGVVPSRMTRESGEASTMGRYLDSKAGISTMNDMNNESAPSGAGPDLYNDLEND